MSDYNNYDFTIRTPEQLIKMIMEAKNHGMEPLLQINGMFYDFDFQSTKEDERR